MTTNRTNRATRSNPTRLLHPRWAALAMTLVVASFGARIPAAVGSEPEAGAGGDPGEWAGTISRRNAFGLRSPPVVPGPEVLVPPRAPRPVIFLRGVADITGRKLACVEARGSDGATRRAIVSEGELFAGVEVIGIDVRLARAALRGSDESWEVDLSPPEAPIRPAPGVAPGPVPAVPSRGFVRPVLPVFPPIPPRLGRAMQ